MTEKLRNEVNNLGLNVFNAPDYEKFIKLLDNQSYNELRLMIDERVSYLEVIAELKQNSSILKVQLSCCTRLEDYIMDAYIETLNLKSVEY